MTESLQLAGVVLFLVSLVLLGMPHGAVDHWVWFRAAGKKMKPLGLILFVLTYVLVAAFFFGLWLWFPVGCAIGLLGLTAYHWGEGDWIWESAKGWKPPKSFWVWRGLIPMGIPFVVHPDMAIAVLESAVLVAANTEMAGISAFTWPTTRWFLLGCLICVFLIQWWQGGSNRPWRLLWEDLGLIAVFVWLPPLMAIAIYFVGWHANRHVRWLARWMGPPVGRASGVVDWRRFSWAAAPFTLPAVGAVAVLAMMSPPEQGQAMAWVGSYLVWLWALTWPHAVVCHFAARQAGKEMRPLP